MGDVIQIEMGVKQPTPSRDRLRIRFEWQIWLNSYRVADAHFDEFTKGILRKMYHDIGRVNP